MCTWDSSLIVGIIGVVVVEETKGNFLNAKKRVKLLVELHGPWLYLLQYSKVTSVSSLKIMISVDLIGKFSQLCDEELYDSLRSAHQSHP